MAQLNLEIMDTELIDVPSHFITGTQKKKARVEMPMSKHAKRFIYDSFRELVDKDSRGDVDGEIYEIDWCTYHITAIHRYQTHEERGGDSYCGICESYTEIDCDSIEVIEVWDVVSDCSKPTLQNILNGFFKTLNHVK